MLNALFAKAALLVACVILAFGLLALLAIFFPTFPSLRVREGKTLWFLRNWLVQVLVWRLLSDLSSGAYFDAIYWFAFGWYLTRRSNLRLRAQNTSQLGLDAFLSLSVGAIGVLDYLGLVGRVLGPVGIWLLKPIVLIPLSFGILAWLVFWAYRQKSTSDTRYSPSAFLQ
jgi:hypothetical protein